MTTQLENKDADQLHGNSEANQRLCFRYTEQSIFFLNPKFQASSHLLLLYSPVCVGPGRKPEDRFSHKEAQMSMIQVKLVRIPSPVSLHFSLKFGDESFSHFC